MASSSAILALFVLLALTSSSSASSKSNPCKPVCLGYKNWNKSTCPWKYCTHKTCWFKTKWGKWKKGHRCTLRPTPTPPPPPPTTCADKCYRWWRDANKGCNRSICKISGCPVWEGGKRVWGHRCTLKIDVPTPPPPPSAKCADKCYRWWRDANKGCNRSICKISGCPLWEGGKRVWGHRCTHKVVTPPSPPPPPPPTTCADKCYRWWRDANKGCNRSICKISGCPVWHQGKRVWGHRCAPKTIVEPSPPPPPPATCNNKCFRWWREANNDCDRRICGITGCKGDGYWGFRCTSLVVKPTPSVLPSVSSSPAPLYPAGCPADCLRRWRSARSRCDPDRCMVVSCAAPWVWWRTGYRCIARPSPSTTSTATATPSPTPSTSPYVPFCPRVCRRRWNAAAKGCDPRGCDVVRCSHAGTWWSFGYECAPKGVSPMPSPSAVVPSIVPKPSSTSTATATPSNSPAAPMASTTATATATPSTSTVPSPSASTPADPGSVCTDKCRRRKMGAERNCDLTKCEIVRCDSTKFTKRGFKCTPKMSP